MSEEWDIVEDKKGQKYYFNKNSLVTTLDKPDALKCAEELFRDKNLRNQKAIDDFDFHEDAAEARPACVGCSDATIAEKGIGAENVGFQLLKKFGWKDTEGLGKAGQGVVEPIKAQTVDSNTGLGKQEEYDSMIAQTTKDRKRLDIEINQSSDVKRQRLENANKEEALQTELKTINKAFYCDICNKQYKNVAEMSNHLSSYDHHHKKRFKAMKQSTAPPTEGRDSIRKREELQFAKEVRKREKMIKLDESDKGTAVKSNADRKDAETTSIATDSALPVGEKRAAVSFSMGFKMKKTKK